jgi:hypothetical protein
MQLDATAAGVAARHIDRREYELEGENFFVAIAMGPIGNTTAPAHAKCVVIRWTNGHEGQHPIFRCSAPPYWIGHMEIE